MVPRPVRFVGINFDHMHMGDLLRMVFDHPQAEIAGICDEDPARMETAIRSFRIPPENVYGDWQECLEKTHPDVAILCPATAQHADIVEQIAPRGVHILIEKPFAATLADADRMIAATTGSGVRLAVNWPLRWYPCHVTAYRLLREGRIGDLQEVHYYGGNRGPLWHAADKQEITPTEEMKRQSWFYRRSAGGGSLLDYLGYGATLGTWYHDGHAPLEVNASAFQPAGLEVDEHSIAVCRYECGLSKYETRWGTFTDPWKHQPQPKCGFVLKGTAGTISSYDFEATVQLQTEACPAGQCLAVDDLAPLDNPIAYFVDRLRSGREIDGPLSPAVSRSGQQIVDAALLSVREKRAVSLLPPHAPCHNTIPFTA